MEIIPKKYRVIKKYISPYPDAIIFHRGDVVEIGKEYVDDSDWKEWIWCEGRDKTKAWVPKQYIDIKENKATFTKDYNARELSVDVGEKLMVYEHLNGFGMAKKSNGMKGWVPLKNLEEES